MPTFYTTRELADLLGTDAWRVRRLFQSGDLPEPNRFAGRRAIPREMIPDVAIALRERGWAPRVSPASTIPAEQRGAAG